MSGPWSCPVCTFRNEGSCSYCNVCEQPKIELQSVPPLFGRSRSHEEAGRPGAQARGAWSFGRPTAASSEGLDLRDTDGEGRADRGEPGLGRRRRSLVSELSEYVSDSTVPSLLNDALAGFVTASFGFAGATVGAVAGALAGRATSSGVVRGAGLGALAGAIVCVEALEASRSYVSTLRAVYPPPPRQRELQGHAAARLMGMGAEMDTSDESVLRPVPPRGPFFMSQLELGAGSPEEELFREQLPVFALDKGVAATAEKCSICLEVPQEQDVMRLLPRCQHSFHRGCIDGWLCRRNFTCPVCRQFVFQ